MASTTKTICPTCGGPAEWTADDGITWCLSPTGCTPSVEYPDYKPPDSRGGK